MGEMAVEGRAGARRTRSDAGTEKGSGRSAPSTPSGRSPDANRLDGKGTPHTPGGLDELAREFFARSDTTESELNAGTGAERRPSSRADDARSVGTAASITGQMQVCADAFPLAHARAPSDVRWRLRGDCSVCVLRIRMPHAHARAVPECPRGARPNRINHYMHPSGQCSSAYQTGNGRCRARREDRSSGENQMGSPNFLSAPAARNIQTFI